MFDGNWRTTVDKGLDPIGHSLRRTGITADVITDHRHRHGRRWPRSRSAPATLRVGFLFLLLTGIPDALDGAVARASGTGSDRGAFFDSVSDRLTDGLLFGGVAWYLASNEPGRIMMLPVAIMGLAMFISYQRAKAESLGYDAKGGIMERAERIIVLALALLFSELLIPILWVMLVLTAITAVQRFVKVWRQASQDRPLPARRQRRQPRSPSAVGTESVWRQRMRERRALPRRLTSRCHPSPPTGRGRFSPDGSLHRCGTGRVAPDRRRCRRVARATRDGGPQPLARARPASSAGSRSVDGSPRSSSGTPATTTRASGSRSSRPRRSTASSATRDSARSRPRAPAARGRSSRCRTSAPGSGRRSGWRSCRGIG